MEEDLKYAFGKIIEEVDIFFDEDGMEQLVLKFSDNSELYLKNNKRNESDDFKIYTEEDESKFIGARILDIKLEENLFSQDLLEPEIGRILIQTDKGDLNVHIENEGVETNLHTASLFTLIWNLN